MKTSAWQQVKVVVPAHPCIAGNTDIRCFWNCGYLIRFSRSGAETDTLSAETVTIAMYRFRNGEKTESAEMGGTKSRQFRHSV